MCYTTIMKRVVVFFLILSTFFIFFSCSKPSVPTIGFYGVDENIRETFTNTLDRWYGDTPYTVLVLDDSMPLAQVLKKNKGISILVSWYGSNAESVSEKLITPPKDLYARYPTTIRTLSDQWMPMLSDHAEIAYRIRNLRNNPEGMPRTLDEVTAYAENSLGKPNTARWPIVIPGFTDRALSMFISSLIESTWNAETAVQLNRLTAEAEQKGLKNSIFEEIRNVPLNDEGATLQSVIDMLKIWQEKDILHPDWQTRKNNYVEILMEDGQAEIVFMPLSVHRTMNFRVVQNFTDSFMPANRTAGQSYSRSLVLPALCVAGVHQKQKDADAETLKLLDFLTSNDEVSTISIVSGLAPLTSSAEAADTQASDVRFYAAASDSMLQDIGSAFISKAERTAFLEEFREAAR